MPVALLDVNVLIALAWPSHAHHEAAHRWFGIHSAEGWATCPQTQAAFVRLSSTPAVVKVLMQPFEAMEILERNLDSPDHRFWPEDAGLLAMQPAIRARILGPKQVNDAQLLDLALRHEGVLATFDQRIANLLPPGDPRLERIRLMPL